MNQLYGSLHDCMHNSGGLNITVIGDINSGRGHEGGERMIGEWLAVVKATCPVAATVLQNHILNPQSDVCLACSILSLGFLQY